MRGGYARRGWGAGQELLKVQSDKRLVCSVFWSRLSRTRPFAGALATFAFIGIIASLLVRIEVFGLSDSQREGGGSMTRMLHSRSAYVWALIFALLVAGAVGVARTLRAIDSYD
jgi:hypothetical protein